MKSTRFIQAADSISERMQGFMAHLRDNGVPVGADEFRYTLSALCSLDVLNPDDVRMACKAVCVSDADAFIQFDDLFEAYWLNGGHEKFSVRRRHEPESHALQKSMGQATNGESASTGAGELDEADNGEGDDASHGGEGKLTGSRIRNIDKVDLREMMTPEALERAEKVAKVLAESMRDKRSRRRRAAQRGSALNMRKVMRASIATGGDPLHLFRQQRPTRPVNIVALLDVSGSMMVYSRVFLAFLKGLVSRDQRTEAYLFHTSLMQVSDVMRDSDTLRAINRLSLMAQGFGGGTRIGASLQLFNQQYAANSVNGRSVVIIFSDGYDTDPPELIGNALARLKKRGCRIIWLNPLKGWKDYEPVAQGMATALPYLDLFAAANTLESLAALEPHLASL
ncbi:MAG: VWA domain-containing protein [Granulosicoccus sp.]